MRHALAVLLLVLAGLPAHAQTELQKMQQQLDARDATIRDLLRRVEALEQRLRPGPGAATTTTTTTTTAVAPVAAAAPAPAAPAGNKEEEDEGLRALERALVRQGGLVLPPHALELEADYDYTHDGNRGLAIVQTSSGAQVAQATSHRRRHEASLGLRIGLPARSQLALRVPYVRVDNESAAPALAVTSSDRASGIGDVEVQLTRQLQEEGPGRAGWLGALAWKPATGDYAPGRAATGAGFASWQLALTAVKRQDPLVFFGTLSFADYRPRDYAGSRYEPGNAVGLKAGTLLAASPQSSLRIGMSVTRTGATRLNGAASAGSDTFVGLIELGLVSLLTPRTSLDLNVGFGVTQDAPRLRIGVAIPVRFR